MPIWKQIVINSKTHMWFVENMYLHCRNPTFGRVGGWHSHPEMGTWESTKTPETLEFDCRGQNTLHWSVFYIIRKLSKCRCRKWAYMNHLDICSTSYGKKKGRELNWQFNSRSLKVRNRLDPSACWWCATHCWKAFDESYKFALKFISIGGLNKKL
jgi:hypothetical protein